MTNIEKLTNRINASRHPRSLYNALMAIAPLICEAQTEQQRTELLEDLQEGGEQHDSKRRI